MEVLTLKNKSTAVPLSFSKPYLLPSLVLFVRPLEQTLLWVSLILPCCNTNCECRGPLENLALGHACLTWVGKHRRKSWLPCPARTGEQMYLLKVPSFAQGSWQWAGNLYPYQIITCCDQNAVRKMRWFFTNMFRTPGSMQLFWPEGKIWMETMVLKQTVPLLALEDFMLARFVPGDGLWTQFLVKWILEAH